MNDLPSSYLCEAESSLLRSVPTLRAHGRRMAAPLPGCAECTQATARDLRGGKWLWRKELSVWKQGLVQTWVFVCFFPVVSVGVSVRTDRNCESQSLAQISTGTQLTPQTLCDAVSKGFELGGV